MEISESDIQNLRSAFFKKIAESNLSEQDDFHPADINRIKSSGAWLRRFLLHHDNDQTEALKMLWDTCEWRKSFGANDISEKNVNMAILEDGSIFSHSHDKDGKALLIFKSKKHVKGKFEFDELKRVLIYWMERLERERNGDLISIFFDMDGAGLSNMDMEYTKYIIGQFKSYYPFFLNNIYILEMAWVLNAAFKVIKSWLPPKAVQKIKFISKSNLKEYVAPEQALKSWGGLDEYVFTFVPEVRAPPVEPERKKVHFVDRSPVSEETVTFSDGPTAPVAASSFKLTITPSDILAFEHDGNELVATIQLSNNENCSLCYKIKTTSPEKYKVRPSAGSLESGASTSISVVVQPGYDSGLQRDKFLVMAMSVPADQEGTDPAELWKIPRKDIVQHRLKCSVPNSAGGDSGRNGLLKSERDRPADSDRQLTKLSAEISKLHNSLQTVGEEVRRVQIQQWVLILLVIVLAAVNLYLSSSRTSCIESNDSCFQYNPPRPPENIP